MFVDLQDLNLLQNYVQDGLRSVHFILSSETIIWKQENLKNFTCLISIRLE